MGRRIGSWVLFALFVLWGCMAVYLVGAAILIHWHASQTEEWPPTSGTILQSAVRGSGDPYEKNFQPVVRYSYKVDGRSYEGDKIDRLVVIGAGWGADERVVAEAIAERYTLRAIVDVFYDPDDPTRALLEPGRTEVANELLAHAFIVAIFAGLFGFGFLRRYWPWRMRRFKQLNFELRVPFGWISTVGKGNEQATLHLVRGKVAVSINGSAADSGAISSSAALAARRVEITSSYASSYQVVRRETIPYSRGEAVLMDLEIEEGGSSNFMHAFFYGYRGFTYEILVHGKAKHLRNGKAERVMREMLMPRFRIIDDECSSFALLAEAPAVTKMPEYGLAFRADNPGWRKSSARRRESECTGFGLLHDDGGILEAFPVYIPEEDTSWDVVCRGLLGFYGIDAADAALVLSDSDEETDSPRRSYRHQRTVGESEYDYRIHLRRWGGVACGFFYAAQSGATGLDERLVEIVESINCEPVSGKYRDLVAALIPNSRVRQARFVAAVGKRLLDSNQYSSAAAMYQAAWEMDSNDAEMLKSWMLAHTRDSRHAEALVVFDEHAAKFADDASVQSFRPFLLRRLDRRTEAIECYEKLLRAGWRDPADMRDFIDSLIEEERTADALARLEEWKLERDDTWLHELVAYVHRKNSDHDQAIASLQAALERQPRNVALEISLAHEYTHAERFQEAIQLCERMAERGHGGAALKYARGVAEARLGWFSQARRSFEEALADEPGNVEYQRWLDHATHELGQGSHRLIRQPIDAVEPVHRRDPVAEDPTFYPDSPAVYLERDIRIRFERGNSFVETTSVRIRIRSAQGVTRFSTYAIRFDPEVEGVFVNEIRVRDADGGTVSTGRLEDFFVKDDDESQGNTLKVINIPVVGLEVGYTLEVTASRRRHGSPTVFPFRRVDLGRGLPILQGALEVSGDLDKVAVVSFGDVAEQTKGDRRHFVVERVAPFVREPWAAAPDSWHPSVAIGEPEESWDEVGREYRKKIEHRLQPVDFGERVSDITKECRTDEEKLAAIAAFVRDELTYKAISFGPRAMVPDPADEVLKARFGDCKGHSILFLQLARAAGLRCHLALVHTGERFVPELPCSAQFNHMIVHCPDLGGGRFLDLVDKCLGIVTPTPSSLGGRTALVITDDGVLIEEIPMNILGQSDLQIQRNVRLRSTSSLELEEQVTLSGHYAAFFRKWLKQVEGSPRQKVAEFLSGLESRFELDDLEVHDLDAYEKPLRLELAYRLENVADTIDEMQSFSLPAILERDYLVPSKVENRITPFQVQIPFRLTSQVTLDVHDGGMIERQGQSPGPVDSDLIQASLTIEANGAQLRLRSDVAMKGGWHEAERYDDFRESLERAVRALECRVVVRKTS